MSEALALLILVPTAIVLLACVLFVLAALGMGITGGIDGLVTALRHHIHTGQPRRAHFGTPALHH